MRFRRPFMNPSTRNRLSAILLHHTILALPVTIIIILLLPDIFDKYKLEPLNQRFFSKGSAIEYHDLDHNGVSEYFYAAPDEVGGSGIAVYSNAKIPYYHSTFKGALLPRDSRCLVGDYDNDGLDEIFAFTLYKDQLLVNVISHRERGSLILRDRILTRIKPYNDTINFMFAPHSLVDLTGDGYKELVTVVNNGYGVIPRRIFALDVRHDSVFSSPELGGLGGIGDTADVDRDGKPEFTFTNYGPGNIEDSAVKMRDNCGYLIALDDNLQFLFPPVMNPGRYSSVNSYFLKEGSRYVIASFWMDTLNAKQQIPMKIFNLEGKLLENRVFKGSISLKGNFIHRVHGRNQVPYFLKFTDGQNIQVYDQGLIFRKEIKPRMGEYGIYEFDFDQDGEKELLYITPNADRWIILRNTFNHPVEINIPSVKALTKLRFFQILNGKEAPWFCVNNDDRQYIFRYGYNAMYPLRYPVYLAIYAAIVSFIILIQYLQRIQLRKTEELRKKLAELQLSSIHNQMDSHFTFNVLNTIGSAIMQDEREKAYDLLGKFSRLLRATLSGSDSVTRSLEEELDFVQNFLQIQQNRFRDLFIYEISVDHSINMKQPVPRGCIQTHVENAIKHGLAPMITGGKLYIDIAKNENYLVIRIRDNGVGREQARTNNIPSTGKGIDIMNQFYDILNKYNKEPITEIITDLFDENGKAKGTEVMVNIPEGFWFSGINLKKQR